MVDGEELLGRIRSSIWSLSLGFVGFRRFIPTVGRKAAV